MSNLAHDLDSQQSESSPKFTVLCVDDEKSILSSLKRVLRRYSYKVHLANSGAEGLEVLAKEHIDLVISDMRMPVMTGAVFLAEVAKKWPDTVRLLLTGYSDLESTITAVNDGEIYRYISKPWDEEDLVQTIGQALEIKRLTKEKLQLSASLEEKNKELEELNSKLEETVENRTEKIQKTYNQIISVFTQLVELREGKVAAGHSKRVSDLSRATAKVMKMPKKQEVDLFMAALLHDIGKVGLEDKILCEPFNQLSPAEKEQYKLHSRRGMSLLKDLPLMEDAAEIILHHHESYDGSGFPSGLSGDEIPASSQILSICNDYDNLICGRKTGNKLNWDESINIIKERAGQRYDPDVVNAFLEVISQNKVFAEGYTLKEYIIKSANLEQGMVLSNDIVTQNGMILLSKELTLDEKTIGKILDYESSNSEELKIFVYR